MSKKELIFNTELDIHDGYTTDRDLSTKFDLLNVRQQRLESKIDKILDFLNNHEALMLQKINDFLSENRRLFIEILNDVIDKENSAKLVVDKINEFLTENRKLYTDRFQDVVSQSKKNTAQIRAIRPLLDNINKTQEGISSLLKLTYSSELDPILNLSED